MPTTKQMSKVRDDVSGICNWALNTEEGVILGFKTFQDEESQKTEECFSLDFPSGAAYRSEEWDEVLSLSKWLRGVEKTAPLTYRKARVEKAKE